MLRPTLALLALAASVSAQISFVHLGTVDISSTASVANPEYIGNNPSAVAWNGTDLWLGGFNSSGAVGDAAMVKISNALTNPTYGARFGVVSTTPNSRGYSGLDVSGNTLVAAYDSGAPSPEGISAWDLNGNNLWLKDARGGSGVALDPGFIGVDAGTGWTTFGSGRRALQDSVTGLDVYDGVTGMDIFAGTGLFWRDMDFDSFSGDIYLRKGNQLIGGIRIGGNAVINMQQLSNVTQGDFVNLQNLAFVRQANEQFVIWNDRPTTNGGQALETVIQASRASDGSTLTIDYGAFTAPAGAAAYDFSYDEASSTLAICDFTNRQVYVFAVSSFLDYGTGCVGVGGITPRLNAYGDTRPNGSITYTLSDLAPLSVGLFAFGDSQTSVPLPFSPLCSLLIAPVNLVAGAFATGSGGPGSGSGSIVLPLPATASGLTLTVQGGVLENVTLTQARTSNAILVTLQ